ncbi:hypothetical protein VTO58DRAFT_101752 [Aureobasidium pullulans]|nr:hypothetical protein JADG_005088 [Aureobasidium pullulans]
MLQGIQEYAEKADKAEKHTRQRWPRPCGICQSRKVKCDRATPCTNCKRRGEDHLCTPEVDRANGNSGSSARKRKRAEQSISGENTIIEDHALGRLNSPTNFAGAEPEAVGNRRPQSLEEEDDDHTVLLAQTPPRPKERFTWNDIILPSSAASKVLVAHDKLWNSWVHQAIYYPQFEKEHDNFLMMRRCGKPLSSSDPSWLAIYFSVLAASLLTMGEDKAATSDLPLADHPKLIRNWYDAALFCLEMAEFMRRPHARTVQAIAILGICFHNLGDHDLRQMMWACAIRIALKIGLNRPENMKAPLPFPSEHCLRLWWTIVICDWLPFPGYTPLINEREVRCRLPAPHVDDLYAEQDGKMLSSVRYHEFMARTAVVYHNFHNALQKGFQTKGETVRQADEQLAQVITTLPEHLEPESGERGAAVSLLEEQHPWVRWQRVNVTLVLLTHRLLIYSTLSANWRNDPDNFQWAKSVCLQSAKDILWINQNWNLPTYYRRQWAHSMDLFKAANMLIQEAKHGRIPITLFDGDWKDEIAKCVTYLEEIRQWNEYAGRAADTIQASLLSCP